MASIMDRIDREEILDTMTVTITFGPVDGRSGKSGDTYRLQFFSVDSSVENMLSGAKRHQIGFVDVPAAQANYFASSLEDAAKALRDHIAKRSGKSMPA